MRRSTEPLASVRRLRAARRKSTAVAVALTSFALAAAVSFGGSVFAAQRVVTLSPHLAELVCAAGACEQLAGVVAYSDYPPAVTKLPQVGDAFNLDLERLAALEPDLVLAWQGGSSMQTVTRLKGLGYDVRALQVRQLDDIGTAIEQLGRWLGTSSPARAAANGVRERLKALRARYRDATPLRVFYEIQVQPLYTINADSPISEALALCGGVNVFAGLPALATTVSLEAVFAARPDVVIYAQQDDRSTREFWRDHDELPAVAAGRLYAVNADLLARATPRMLDGIEQLCSTLDRAR
jgi:iron complex transport system substrate-binding protein